MVTYHVALSCLLLYFQIHFHFRRRLILNSFTKNGTSFFGADDHFGGHSRRRALLLLRGKREIQVSRQAVYALFGLLRLLF